MLPKWSSDTKPVCRLGAKLEHLLVEGLDRADAHDIVCDCLKAPMQRRGLSLLEGPDCGGGVGSVNAVNRQKDLAERIEGDLDALDVATTPGAGVT